MKRTYAALVQSIRIRAKRQQILYCRCLCRRFPVVCVRRVMKRLGSAAILRVAISAMRNQKLRDRTPKGGGSHMQGCIACVQVVGDFGEKEV